MTTQNGYRTIRIRATGQVTEMVPDVARAMLNSGMAEEVNLAKPAQPEAMALGRAERAVAPAQNPQPKPAFSRKRVEAR